MLLPCTRMAMKTNLNRIKLTTISATARASVRRGRRPTRSLPHQELTSSEGFLLGSNCTAVIGTHPQYFSFVKAGTPASREYPARSTPVHPEVVGHGARRSRRFNLSTPLRSGNFSVFPIPTPKRAEARAPTNTNNLGMHGVNPRSGPSGIHDTGHG